MTSTPRVKARRERLSHAGWRLIQVELSPAATQAVSELQSDGATLSQVVERAVCALAAWDAKTSLAAGIATSE